MSNIEKTLIAAEKADDKGAKLRSGSKVAVVGGGPAGSFFSHFLLKMAKMVELDIEVDIYEMKNYFNQGPAGCNKCGGIVSESLVQMLAAEGINLPEGVVQRGIDSYKMHIGGERAVYIDEPLHSKRIAAVHRGAGPLGSEPNKWRSFDGFLLNLAMQNGARVIEKKVDDIKMENGRPVVTAKGAEPKAYDLVTIAAGVNASNKFQHLLEPGDEPPKTTQTFICELPLGNANVQAYFGNAMHVFLPEIPRIEFAAMIPKGDYVTTCLLGEDIDRDLVTQFLNTPEVKKCLPPGWAIPEHFCKCAPRMNVGGSRYPFADRILFVGDSGVARLYKDGIGSAYRTAKAAASAAVFEGVSRDDFRRHYLPACKKIERDNDVGRLLFMANDYIRKFGFLRRAVLSMVVKEHDSEGERRMSGILWDMFTGSSPYSNIFWRGANPAFWLRFAWNILFGRRLGETDEQREDEMGKGSFGEVFKDGEVIVSQGDRGDRMYVIQAGEVEVFIGENGKRTSLAVLKTGDIFGEMALFDEKARSASVRAVGEVRVIAIDKKTLLRRIHEDPTLAFRMLEKMSTRIRDLDHKVS